MWKNTLLKLYNAYYVWVGVCLCIGLFLFSINININLQTEEAKMSSVSKNPFC